jgi:hypothetical protein
LEKYRKCSAKWLEVVGLGKPRKLEIIGDYHLHSLFGERALEDDY